MVFLNYARPAEDVEALLAAHIEGLDRYFDAGFLLQRDVKIRAQAACCWSGIWNEKSRMQDPFVALAQYEVTKVYVTRAAEAFAGLKGV